MSSISQQSSPATTRVWDLGVRLFHWSLVAMVLGAYLTEDLRKVHRYLGYVVLALLTFRLVWGLIGGRHARFASFLPGPRRLIAYLRDILSGTERRYLGHNPAGAAMIVALLVTLGLVGGSGYMMGMDQYYGKDWLEELHEALADGLLVLIALHVTGVVLASYRHSENLVRAMISGRKRVDDHPGPY
jgi:cytochrome b